MKKPEVVPGGQFDGLFIVKLSTDDWICNCLLEYPETSKSPCCNVSKLRFFGSVHALRLMSYVIKGRRSQELAGDLLEKLLTRLGKDSCGFKGSRNPPPPHMQTQCSLHRFEND